jgi:membrane fusion protein (multidrug efflux system)
MGLFRQLLIVIVLAGVGYGGYVLYLTYLAPPAETADTRPQRGSQPVSIEVETAKVVTLDRKVEAVGTTRALQSVDIVPSAEGRITALEITPGQEIKAGTVIARLDDEMEVATLEEVKSAVEEKQRALERAQTLIRSNTISQANLEQLRSGNAVAQAALARAERSFADRTIRAPFDGVLGITSVDLGARVDTDTVLTTLDDLSEVEIEFRLPETVYGQISAGQSIEATSAAFPDRRFTGEVAAIDSRIDQTSRAFRVRARLPNEDRALPVGMFMRLDLNLASRQGVVVPEEALLVQGPTTYLYVIEDGTARQRKVETGQRRKGLVEITDGVSEGDVVASRGIQSLRDGSKVKILNPANETTGRPSAGDVRTEGRRG